MMVYFPKEMEVENVPKKCPGCGKWYVRNPAMEGVSCCLYHSPGSCCHFSETEVQNPNPETDDG